MSERKTPSGYSSNPSWLSNVSTNQAADSIDGWAMRVHRRLLAADPYLCSSSASVQTSTDLVTDSKQIFHRLQLATNRFNSHKGLTPQAIMLVCHISQWIHATNISSLAQLPTGSALAAQNK